MHKPQAPIPLEFADVAVVVHRTLPAPAPPSGPRIIPGGGGGGMTDPGMTRESYVRLCAVGHVCRRESSWSGTPATRAVLVRRLQSRRLARPPAHCRRRARGRPRRRVAGLRDGALGRRRAGRASSMLVLIVDDPGTDALGWLRRGQAAGAGGRPGARGGVLVDAGRGRRDRRRRGRHRPRAAPAAPHNGARDSPAPVARRRSGRGAARSRPGRGPARSAGPAPLNGMRRRDDLTLLRRASLRANQCHSACALSWNPSGSILAQRGTRRPRPGHDHHPDPATRPFTTVRSLLLSSCTCLYGWPTGRCRPSCSRRAFCSRCWVRRG